MADLLGGNEEMAKRPKRSQSKHDAEVSREAKNLKDKGYNVKADIRGYPQPDTIGGFRPDGTHNVIETL